MIFNLPNIQDIQQLLPSGASNLEYYKRGGFKAVYTVEIKGEKHAVKLVYIPEDPSDPETKQENLKRIRREIELIDKCDSNFLIKISDFKPKEVQLNGHTYLLYIEEFIDGKDLDSIIKAGNLPSQDELKLLANCVIDCIEELKLRDAVHRDIKPANIIKNNNEERAFVLIDLGLAFLVQGTNLTRNPKAIPGTRAYLAPEMFENNFRKRLDFRADLHNLGLTIYEYATGKHPYKDSSNQYSTLMNIMNITPKSLKNVRGDIDEEFSDLVDSWLKKKPMLRASDIPKIKEILS
jgi:serine/threonine-protein kinase